MSVFFTSDHHFGHKNIIEYAKRPFSDVDEMNHEMITRWNEVVKPYDAVYHLGDFTLGGFSVFREFIQQLNGNIKIVPGGHDHRWTKHYMGTQLCDPLITLKISKKLTIVLCHYPLRTWHKSHYGSLHLYGHSHGNLEPLPNSMDVGVDCHNFYPINLVDVLEKLQWQPN